MHSVYPSNDHPRDKASFSFHIDAPTGETVVANGVLTSKKSEGQRTFWTYEQRQPMATELTQLAAGSFRVAKGGSVHGVAVRDVVPTRFGAEFDKVIPLEKEQLAWMEQAVGKYPFDAYGSLLAEVNINAALETQTLSLIDSPLVTKYPEGVWSPILLHELAHQWFGDSVAPSNWSDVWLNEGHASYYEHVYAAEKGFLKDDAGADDFEGLMKSRYALGDQWRAQYGAVAQPTITDVGSLFNDNVYDGGALVLYALKQKVGPAVFAKIERSWTDKYAGRAGSTADFITLASRISGSDVSTFLHAWLYDLTTPAMPGHPDWTVNPASSGGGAPSRATATAPGSEVAAPSGLPR
jgi:aminopeptidase N